MATVRGVYRGGRLELLGPVPDDWSEGEEVVLETVSADELQSEIPQLDDPESLARWEAWLESVEPFLSPEDEAAWEAALAEQKRWELGEGAEKDREAAELFR